MTLTHTTPSTSTSSPHNGSTASAPTASARRHGWISGLLPYVGVVLFLGAVGERALTGTLDGSHTLIDAVTYLIGYAGVGAGIAHIFFGGRISRSIGFQANGYQTEVGFADLAMGITALLAAYFVPEYSLAIILTSSIFRIGAGFGHIRSMLRDRNFAINNTAILGVDFLVPAFLIAAYLLWA